MVDFGQVPLGWETQLDILQLGGLGPRTISILIRKLGNSSVQPMNENHSLDSVSVISSENNLIFEFDVNESAARNELKLPSDHR